MTRCRSVRRIPYAVPRGNAASAFAPSLTKRIPRNGYASPSGIVMPRWCRASTPSGISPSPQGLSIGGTAPSARTTLKPRRRAAMAVARPAGPPPITNTSTGFGKLLTINFLSTNFLPSISYLNALLPFQQNEFRAEPGTHRGQQAERTGFGAAILHNFFEHHQHGSRRQVASPAQALPGNVEFTIL